jgi:hypothetical protein
MGIGKAAYRGGVTIIVYFDCLGMMRSFPRSTSREFLPPVYRECRNAEDFTERFLSLFDAGIANQDRAIERYNQRDLVLVETRAWIQQASGLAAHRRTVETS